MSKTIGSILERICWSTSLDLSFVSQPRWGQRLFYGEETITERVLLQLAQGCAARRGKGKLKVEVRSIAHCKAGATATSEPKTGADWEWHFGNHKGDSWFRVRVQAKKGRKGIGNKWGYHDLANKRTRYNRRQIDVLIEDAGSTYWPVYALYDGHFFEKTTALRSCPECTRNDPYFGALTCADAGILRAVVRAGEPLDRDTVRQVSVALPCLVDCADAPKTENDLPAQLRSFATALWDASIEWLQENDIELPAEPTVPGTFAELPEHITDMLDELPGEGAGPVYRVDGRWRADLAERRGPGRPSIEKNAPLGRLAGVVLVQDEA